MGIYCPKLSYVLLRTETEENILEYLKPQGVTYVKRFKIKKNGELVNTNTLLLTFNTVVAPQTLKIFYQIIPVDLYVPNPLRCFNCQKFGHHESNCPSDEGSVCERCGAGNYDHLSSQCRNPPKWSIVEEIICQDQVTVMSGKKKRKS